LALVHFCRLVRIGGRTAKWGRRREKKKGEEGNDSIRHLKGVEGGKKKGRE